MERLSRPCDLFASEQSHRFVTHCWQRCHGRAGMIAAMKLLPTFFWLALATGALLASYVGIDLRLLAAGCIGIAVLSGSGALSKSER